MPIIPLILLALILGLPAVLIVLTASRWSYVLWMLVYLVSLPIWNFVLPTYAYWKFDDFSWGDTRKTAGEKVTHDDDEEGEFDSSKITMKRWKDFERGEFFLRSVPCGVCLVRRRVLWVLPLHLPFSTQFPLLVCLSPLADGDMIL